MGAPGAGIQLQGGVEGGPVQVRGAVQNPLNWNGVLVRGQGGSLMGIQSRCVVHNGETIQTNIHTNVIHLH